MRTVGTVLLVGHQLIVVYVAKEAIFDVIKVTFYNVHLTPRAQSIKTPHLRKEMGSRFRTE